MERKDKISLKRGFKSRHVTMIALGSSIGTGLFLASGQMISQSGPGGALLSYMLMGTLIYFLMHGLGEIATYRPVTGSIMTFTKEYVDSALGFSVGWIYYYNCISSIAMDVITAGIFMGFWFPNIPIYVFTTLFFAVILAVNLLSSKSFGELEFWIVSIKVITIIIFLIVGIMIILGLTGHEPLGFKNFFYDGGPFIGNVNSLFSVLILAALSFSGIELIGITAGEVKNPSKSMPKAINTILLRILIFYIGTIFIIGAIVPYTSPYLLSSEMNLAITPFALVFQYTHIPAVDSIMNFIILTAIISACNTEFYASTRILYSLGKEKFAPKKFTLANKRGMPYISILITMFTLIISFIVATVGYEAYLILINGIGVSTLIIWLCLGLSHYRFRRGYKKQGLDLNKLKFKAKLFPIGPIIVIFGTTSMLIYNLFSGILTNPTTTLYLFVPLILFVVLFSYHKINHKTKLIPLDQIKFLK
ncbi:MAG: amino acid permease [Methanobrevibacter sp.]|jgi:lysine-specific permease|nr:amino acid permease [Candidatus Methanovirga aequatorialis]